MKHLSVRFAKIILAVGNIAIIVGVLGYAGYVYLGIREENMLLSASVRNLEASGKILKASELRLTQENTELSEALANEQAKNSAFENQIREIAGTVGLLQKLSITDKELLKKYSKVYFLSENYIPARLTELDPNYLYENGRAQRFHADALRFLYDMLRAATSDGIELKIVSAYRSFYDQIVVKTGYKVIYGSGANQFSADQGYSEHQLGTAADFTSPELKGNGPLVGFQKTKSYAWLGANAHRFGFVLSYPEDNSFYQFEPWHWRFVGVQLATRLHDEEKFFYEVPQRDIDAYLISIFD